MDSTTFTTSNLHFTYASTPVLRELNLTFAPGKVHGIVGPNGSGKSTLLDVLCGHLVPTNGTVCLNQIPVADLTARAMARSCTLVPQELDFNFPFTVFETILMGRHPHIPRFTRPAQTDLDIVDQCMEIMDLAPLCNRILADLSGGEKQRTVVARGLAQETPTLILDEPTSSMDIRHAHATMTELQRLAHDRNRTVIAVLHDLNLAARFCDSITMLMDGIVHVSGPVAETLTPDNINTVFQVRATLLGAGDTTHIAFS